MKPPRRSGLRRTFAVLFTALAIAPGLSAQAYTAHADDGPGLNGLTFTSVNNGRNLDVQNGNTGDGVFIVTNSAPGHHQKWSASAQPDGSFTLVNDATGKCIEASTTRSSSGPVPERPVCAGTSSP